MTRSGPRADGIRTFEALILFFSPRPHEVGERVGSVVRARRYARPRQRFTAAVSCQKRRRTLRATRSDQQQAIHRGGQILALKWFAQDFIGATFDGDLEEIGVADPTASRDGEDRYLGIASTDLRYRLDAVLVAHNDVGDDQLRRRTGKHTKAFIAIGRANHLVPSLLKGKLNCEPNRDIVIDHQNASHRPLIGMLANVSAAGAGSRRRQSTRATCCETATPAIQRSAGTMAQAVSKRLTTAVKSSRSNGLHMTSLAPRERAISRKLS